MPLRSLLALVVVAVAAVSIVPAGAEAPTTTVPFDPPDLPGPVRHLEASSGDGLVIIRFDAPETAVEVVRYSVTATNLRTGSRTSIGGTTSRSRVFERPGGDWYRIEVWAESAEGWGPSSFTFARTAHLDPGPTIFHLAPEAVVDLRAVPGDGSVTLEFDEPESTLPVTGYGARITDLSSGADRTISGSAAPLRATGLTDGRWYRFEVWGISAYGRGRSDVVVARSGPPDPPPPAVPGPVRDLRAGYNPHDGLGTALWYSPDRDPRAVLGYQVRVDGEITEIRQVYPRHEFPLALGESALVEVRAIGPGGVPGPWSSDTSHAATVPSVPSITEVGFDGDAITVNWDPSDGGGFPVESYDVRIGGQRARVGGDVRSWAAAGFEVGERVEIRLRARNVVLWSKLVLEVIIVPDPPPGDDPPPVDDPPVGDPPGDDPPVGDPPVDDPPGDDPPVDGPPEEDPPPSDPPPPPASDPPSNDDPPAPDPPATPAPAPIPPPDPAPAPPGAAGYWMAQATGELHGFGAAGPHVGAAGPVVAVATDAAGSGLWVLSAGGVVTVRGEAVHFGDVDVRGLGPRERITTISVRPEGDGYWVFTDRGRALAFGAARFFGDMSGVPLNGRIVASAATASGEGYWLVGSDGGIFSFGDASFAGSTGSLTLNEPVVGIAPDPDGRGYWLVAADGGIFAFDAPFRGSVPGALPAGASINAPVIGALAFGDGYLLVAADGGIFSFSDQGFLGSLGAQRLVSPVVGVAAFSS
ncbi:MAG: hypothetical protein AAFZ07_17545 [Actinomycetota bacterium]